MERIYQSKADEVINQVCGISSGTLATLTGLNKYDDLDRVHIQFVQHTIAALSSNPKEYSCWQDAWSWFVNSNPQPVATIFTHF
jgi:hypothetical protein